MVMAEPIIVRVGNYEIIRTIGKGNFASVKLARHRIAKTEVAIKIIEKFRLDQADLKKIYREIQILKLLRHPHIIKLYEVIETNTKIYLVCEYASHGEVFDYITQEEKIPEEKARKMFYQVLTAIEYCHKHNVVHRDLKAENLLLDANDNIKLADFGFGNFFQSGQNLNTWCGSPPYAAPEVFEGKLYEGPQLDIWSLGIVLYVLVCGTFPFDGSNLASLKERVLAGRFRIPYWMSQDCENLIRRMLVVNPKKRLTIAQIKKHKWLEPVVGKPETPFRNCDSPSRRMGSNQLPEFNEHILKNMIESLGIDRQKTLESLRSSSYDYLYAIYHLLVDRLKQHRTSVPVETKFSYDGGKRRPSNIAEQSIAKHSQAASLPTKPSEQPRYGHKTQFFHTHHKPVHATLSDATPTSRVSDSADVMPQRRDVHFADDTGNDMLVLQRSLALGALPVPHISQPPLSPSATNKPKYLTQPCRGPLPHQPWSFNAGLGVRAVYRKSNPNPIAVGVQQRGSGDVTPSVTSIDEGVEMRSASPSELEMIKLASQQQRRNTLGVPVPDSHRLLGNVVTKGGELAFQFSKPADGSQADSMFGSSGMSMYQESDAMNGSLDLSSDVTPKVVLSPCLEDAAADQPVKPQDAHAAYVEQQRQLLDVSPTGFREGRRASDGLLLLGDNRIGEHLKRLTRANQFPPISQDETDDSCFECGEKGRETCHRAFLKLNPDFQNNELGTMTSHSSHHVMQPHRADVINFQPYTSPNRRCSLQVAQRLTEERCSSYSKGFEAHHLVRQQAVTFQPTQVIQHSGRSCDQPDDDHPYQWSSWKTVTEKELPNNDNLQQRRDTIPLLNRTNMGAFPVWSDDSMSKSSSVDHPIRHPHSSGQSMAQLLQKRRINRRRHIALHSQQATPSYTVQMPDFELLRIVDNNLSGSGSFPTPPTTSEDITGRFSNSSVLPQINNFGSLDAYQRGGSPDLQQSLLLENREASAVAHQSPRAFTLPANGNFSMWAESQSTSSSLPAATAMDYSS